MAASASGIGGRSGRVHRGQQVSGGGAVAVKAVAAGQESTPTARPFPLYRLYCALSLEFWAIPLILRFHSQTLARPSLILRPTRKLLNFSADIAPSRKTWHIHAITPLQRCIAWCQRVLAWCAHIFAVSKVTMYRRLLPSS